MQLARVVGTVVATQKHAKFEGAKLLLVQPLTLDDQARGPALLAVDSVGAGVHEKVLIVIEGRAAGEALGRKGAPVDAAIIGIVDHVDIEE
jgi:ethanolamine utilization protein EutN